MKKKVIIVSHNLRIGGVERSLIGLLDSFDYNKYDVDLFLYLHDGELYDLIHPNVNVIPENKLYAGWLLPIKNTIQNGYWKMLLAKVIATVKSKKYIKKHKLSASNLVYPNYLHKYLVRYLPIISEKEYDLCISFLTPHYIAASKVKSKRKIAWIHTDYSYFEFDETSEIEMWNQYDYIAAISDQSKISFLSKFSVLEGKVITIENILSVSFIKQQANEPIKDIFDPNFINLCSIGRFCDQKNFDNIPYICKYILDSGCKIRWYLIGYGGDENLIRSKIEEAQMQENVIILGKKNNPYPYIKACDIYVQPSRYEGKAVTVREAQILNKPVIITNYTTSSSQLEDGVDGIIVPMDNESCAKGISMLIEDRDMQNRLIENCRQSDYSKNQEVERIYKIISQ